MKYNPVEIARQFLYIRESGANTGNRVDTHTTVKISPMQREIKSGGVLQSYL